MPNNYSDQNLTFLSIGKVTESQINNPTIQTKIVTVKDKTSAHPYIGQGSSKGYFIDGKESPSLTLRQNVAYRFDQSDSSNNNHSILFFTDANRVYPFQKNVSQVGIAGSLGAYTEIILNSETPVEIYYQCVNHPFMGSNIKSSTSGDDSLISTSKNDLFDGGTGSDTVTLTGKFSDYSFTRTPNTLDLQDKRTTASDGSDTLSNIEYIQFSDQKVDVSKVDIVKTFRGNFSDYKFYNKGNGNYQIKTDSGFDDITGLPLLTFTGEKTTSPFRDISAIVDIKRTFDQVKAKDDVTGKMFRVYNAAFNRFPDSDGLEYWIEKNGSGENTERQVAESFLASNEFKEKYGEDLSNEQYVKNLYQNILDREPDAEGYNYWIGQLNNGIEDRSELLLGFAESTENKALFTEMTGFG